MNIPTQLREAIATLPPEESEELTELIDACLRDSELKKLVDENLDCLVRALRTCPKWTGYSDESSSAVVSLSVLVVVLV